MRVSQKSRPAPLPCILPNEQGWPAPIHPRDQRCCHPTAAPAPRPPSPDRRYHSHSLSPTTPTSPHTVFSASRKCACGASDRNRVYSSHIAAFSERMEEASGPRTESQTRTVGTLARSRHGCPDVRSDMRKRGCLSCLHLAEMDVTAVRPPHSVRSRLPDTYFRALERGVVFCIYCTVRPCSLPWGAGCSSCGVCGLASSSNSVAILPRPLVPSFLCLSPITPLRVVVAVASCRVRPLRVSYPAPSPPLPDGDARPSFVISSHIVLQSRSASVCRMGCLRQRRLKRQAVRHTAWTWTPHTCVWWISGNVHTMTQADKNPRIVGGGNAFL